MKRILLYFICLFFILSLYTGFLFPSACSAQKDKYSCHQVTIAYPDTTIKTYILNQKLRIKPRENTEYYWVYNHKINKNKGDYSYYLIHGPFLVFDVNDRLITKGEFKLGLKDGPWKSWYPDGQIREISHYENGERQGACYSYDPTGELQTILSYRSDMLDGRCEYHSNSETLIKKYKNGEETEPWSVLKFFSSIKAERDTIPDKQ
jgi:hypothetical protein